MPIIYEGTDERGRAKRSFILKNNLEAAKCLKSKSTQLFPEYNTSGYKRLYILKAGTMVLFYENDREELLNASTEELARRLYKVTGFSLMRIQQYEYGLASFVHHQEARASGDIKAQKGVWRSSDPYRAKIDMNHNQIMAMVEGVDFKFNNSGQITFLFND